MRKVDGTRVLFLDEPTSSLDLAHQLLVLDKFRRAAESDIAIICVLNDLNLAAHYAHKLVMMYDGEIVAIGAPSDVFADEILSKIFSC